MFLRDISSWNKKDEGQNRFTCLSGAGPMIDIGLTAWMIGLGIKYTVKSPEMSFFFFFLEKNSLNNIKLWDSPNKRSNGRSIIQRIFGLFSRNRFLTSANRLSSQASSTSILTKKKYVLCVPNPFFYLDFGLRPRTRVVALQVPTRWPVHTSGSSRCNSEKSPPAKIHAHMPAATQKRVSVKSSSVKTETYGKCRGVLKQFCWYRIAVRRQKYISMNVPVQQYERS